MPLTRRKFLSAATAAVASVVALVQRPTEAVRTVDRRTVVDGWSELPTDLPPWNDLPPLPPEHRLPPARRGIVLHSKALSADEMRAEYSKLHPDDTFIHDGNFSVEVQFREGESVKKLDWFLGPDPQAEPRHYVVSPAGALRLSFDGEQWKVPVHLDVSRRTPHGSGKGALHSLE